MNQIELNITKTGWLVDDLEKAADALTLSSAQFHARRALHILCPDQVKMSDTQRAKIERLEKQLHRARCLNQTLSEQVEELTGDE